MKTKLFNNILNYVELVYNIMTMANKICSYPNLFISGMYQGICSGIQAGLGKIQRIYASYFFKGIDSQEPPAPIKPKFEIPLFRNRSNSCFLSSIFWVLWNSPFLRGALEDAIQRKRIQGDQEGVDRLGKVCEFLKKCDQNTDVIDGAEINIFRKVFGLPAFGQQDAAEAFSQMINPIFEGSKYEVKLREMKNCDNNSTRNKLSNNWGSLELHIATGKKSVQTLLNDYLFYKSPDSNCKIRDEKGIERTVVSEIHSFEKAPECLTILLKRYRFDRKTQAAVKCLDEIQAEKILVLPTEKGNETYQLCGLVSHRGGSTKSGHYVANIERNGKWYLCNDLGASVEEVNEVEKVPYVLFYRKVSS